MSNFFSDFAGGYLGNGPGTNSASAYDSLGTIGQMRQDRWRNFLSTDPANIALGGGIFAPNYQAIPQGQIDTEAQNLQSAYDQNFNPFLQQIMSGVDKNLSQSGLLTAGRSAFTRGYLGNQLAVQSALPTAELKNRLTEQNNSDTWGRRMQVLNQSAGDVIPNQITYDNPQTSAGALGSMFGIGAVNRLSGGGGTGQPNIQSGNIPGLQGGMPYSQYNSGGNGGGSSFGQYAMQALPYLMALL